MYELEELNPTMSCATVYNHIQKLIGRLLRVSAFLGSHLLSAESYQRNAYKNKHVDEGPHRGRRDHVNNNRN